MSPPLDAAVIGGGPAGLMAAERLAAGGLQVEVFDAMPSVGRKFLLAGIGGMNITHSEPFDDFVPRYRERAAELRPLLEAFGPAALRDWIHGIGIETFVGTSGRVFPREMKAAPLLRAWLARLRTAGVRFHPRHRWLGWNADGGLRFLTPGGEHSVNAGTTVLALGGASWPRLGSDAAWVPLLQEKGVEIAPLRAANCGFEIAWSEFFRARFAGVPVKPVTLSFRDVNGEHCVRHGEFVVTAHGIEGSLVYAVSAPLRDALERDGHVRITLDLAPGRSETALRNALAAPRKGRSLSEHLRRRAGIHGVKAALLREAQPELPADAGELAQLIKSLPLLITAARPVKEAISTAGGISFTAIDGNMMLKDLPGVFVAGEMLDWEAPTGGYLLTACFATGYAAGEGALRWRRMTPEA